MASGSFRQAQELTLDILRACGLDTKNVRKVVYSHEVGEMPTLDVEYIVQPDPNVATIIRQSNRYTPIPDSSAVTVSGDDQDPALLPKTVRIKVKKKQPTKKGKQR